MWSAEEGNLACEREMSNPHNSYVVIGASMCLLLSCKQILPSSSLCLCAGVPLLDHKVIEVRLPKCRQWAGGVGKVSVDQFGSNELVTYYSGTVRTFCSVPIWVQ